jgi:hypothetical protein
VVGRLQIGNTQGWWYRVNIKLAWLIPHTQADHIPRLSLLHLLKPLAVKDALAALLEYVAIEMPAAA